MVATSAQQPLIVCAWLSAALPAEPYAAAGFVQRMLGNHLP